MRKTGLLVIGAGTAGLAAAQYGARAGLDITVLEGPEPGGQALNIETLENYPGWSGSGRDFAAALRLQAEGFGAKFMNASALSLEIFGKGSGRYFSVTMEDGVLQAKAVILALGAEPRKLDIPGEEEFYGMGVSYCAACDGPFFRNKKILVIGGGDAACDSARALARIAASVTIVHRRGELRAQKAVAERVLKDERIKVMLNYAPSKIHGGGQVHSVVLTNTETGKKIEEAADAVFIYAGLVARNGIVQKPELIEKPELDEYGFIVTGQDMSTSVSGLFCAGDLRASAFRQVVTAASDGAVAAHSAAAYIDQTLENNTQ
jgi:thioredoxin reductase (NADPH)